MIGLMLFMSKKIGGSSRKYFQKQQALLGQLNGNIEEAIGGLKEVKVFNHEETMKKEFRAINENFRDAATKANFYAGVIMPIMGNLNNIVYAGTAVFGGILTINGSFDLGSLAAFLQYSRHVGMPINQITGQINNVLAAIAGAERIFDVMDRDPEVDSGDVTLLAVKKDAMGDLMPIAEGEKAKLWAWKVPDKNGAKAELVPLKGDVRFEDVDFSYDGRKIVLEDLSLHALPGDTPRLRRLDGRRKDHHHEPPEPLLRRG